LKIELLLTGKTDRDYLVRGLSLYEERVKRYCNFIIRVIPALKSTSSMSEEMVKAKEGESILKNLQDGDFLVLLDVSGKEISSEEFAEQIQKWGVDGVRRVVFAVGGAYGFSGSVYERAQLKISLSRMTFSHQMVRLIFVEQLYRAFTIIRGEPYHHK
jgi:23S rRNA (pseudouridine1915-N3)-methyltransferase